MPALIEYDKSTNDEILNVSNIIVLNIHKLQKRLFNSPVNSLPNDYFDMIIIDEAHHSTANTWVETVNYFHKAKVVKLTGTPVRTDGEKLAGDLVYTYRISQAMAKGYIKSLYNIDYIPDKLVFTVDNIDDKEYTLEELYENNIKDEDWVKRSVAYSKDCSNQVVKKSIEILAHKKQDTDVPHKIIAVACSINHAEQIKQLYIENKCRVEVIHSELDELTKYKIKNDIKNNRLDVIVNVAMLGEGYDHKYLSVAAIFRPYKSQLPYEQFIGRVLRVIPEDEVKKISDNIAEIVSHHHLGLHDLWDNYKKEIDKSEIIKFLQDKDIFDASDISDDGKDSHILQDLGFGSVTDNGEGEIKTYIFLETELIKKCKEDEEKEKQSIEKLQEILNISREEALSVYKDKSTKTTNHIGRPDKYFNSKRKDIDVEIREIIIPELISKHRIDKDANDLSECKLFSTKEYSWIIKKGGNNSGYLAIYFNTYLKSEIGKNRDKWVLSDYKNAIEKLDIAKEYVDMLLLDFYKK